MKIQSLDEQLRAELRHARVYLEFFRSHIRALNASELKVYLAIAYHSDADGLSKLTTKTICIAAGVNRIAVYQALFGHKRNKRPGMIKMKIIRRYARDGKAYFYEIVRPAKLAQALENGKG